MQTDALTEHQPVLNADFMRKQPMLAAHMLENMDPEDVIPLIAGISARDLFAVLEHCAPGLTRALLEHCDVPVAAGVISLFSIPRAALLLRHMPGEFRDDVLSSLDSQLRQYLELLLASPPNQAGSVMDPRVFPLQPTMTVQEALDLLRGQRFHRRPTQSRRILLLLDDDGRLLGIVAIQDLALAGLDETLEDFMQKPPASVTPEATREEILEVLEENRVSSLPVVNAEGRLVGIVRQEELDAIAREDAIGDIQAMFGVSREEQALSPPLFSVRQRLPWLQINLFTAFAAAAVVGLFEDVIASYTALAVLLPVVAGQSGNTGAQALAVVMRGLALREISLGQWPRVLHKELQVGLLNGLGVAVTTMLMVFLWSRSLGLMTIIGLAMVLSMVLAGIAGSAVPLVLTRLGLDPAQSSSIIMTTITDIMGFFSFLGIATLLLWTL